MIASLLERSLEANLSMLQCAADNNWDEFIRICGLRPFNIGDIKNEIDQLDPLVAAKHSEKIILILEQYQALEEIIRSRLENISAHLSSMKNEQEIERFYIAIGKTEKEI